jgi:hypothetical protein
MVTVEDAVADLGDGVAAESEASADVSPDVGDVGVEETSPDAASGARLDATSDARPDGAQDATADAGAFDAPGGA